MFQIARKFLTGLQVKNTLLDVAYTSLYYFLSLSVKAPRLPPSENDDVPCRTLGQKTQQSTQCLVVFRTCSQTGQSIVHQNLVEFVWVTKGTIHFELICLSQSVQNALSSNHIGGISGWGVSSGDVQTHLL